MKELQCSLQLATPAFPDIFYNTVREKIKTEVSLTVLSNDTGWTSLLQQDAWNEN